MTDLVLWLACGLPVLCMLVLSLGIGLFSWRVIARTESAHRDMLKAVLVLAQSPTAPQLAGMMETTDVAAAKAETEKVQGRMRAMAH